MILSGYLNIFSLLSDHTFRFFSTLFFTKKGLFLKYFTAVIIVSDSAPRHRRLGFDEVSCVFFFYDASLCLPFPTFPLFCGNPLDVLLCNLRLKA